MTEEQALRQMQRGSQEALAWFIDRYGAYVSAVIRGILGTALAESDVEETASDVFFSLWNNAGKVHSGAAAMAQLPWPATPPATGSAGPYPEQPLPGGRGHRWTTAHRRQR